MPVWFALSIRFYLLISQSKVFIKWLYILLGARYFLLHMKGSFLYQISGTPDLRIRL